MTTTETTTGTLLPHELIFDNILSRLPDDSLIRMGCVCKLSYNSIHHDPNFCSAHFALKNPIVMFHFFNVGRHSPPTSRINSLYYFYLNEEDALMISKENNKGVELRSLISLPYKKHNIFHNLVGCFNDLICMYMVSAESGGGSIQICNPSKRQVINISPPPIVGSIKGFGFGFDSITNEYKVVWIIVKGLEYHCFVYTLEGGSSSSGSSSSSWKEVTGVGPCLLSIEGPSSAVSCSGALYWRTDQHSRVLSFDLHDEKFQFIEIPFNEINIPCVMEHFMEYRGNLCFAGIQVRNDSASEKCIVHLFEYVLKNETRQTFRSENRTTGLWTKGGTLVRYPCDDTTLWTKRGTLVRYPCDDTTRIVCFFDQVFVSWFRGDHFLFYNLDSGVFNVVKFPNGYFTEKEHLDALHQITKNDYNIFNHVSNYICLGNLRF